MIEVVDHTEPAAGGVSAAVRARVDEILRTRVSPTRGYLIAPALVGGLLAAPGYGAIIAPADQRWWRCPCNQGGTRCPYAVLYGRVQGAARVGLAPAVHFEEPARARVDGVEIVAVNAGSVADIDAIPQGIEAAGRPGLATMLMVWFEMGLRDTLTVALGRAEA